MVCYDLEFPEWVRAVALRGAELLVRPDELAASSRARTASGRWRSSR